MSLRKFSFKWFGSLTNLSFRRSIDKSESKPRSGGGRGCSNGGTILEGAAESTVDDLEAMRPRTASYVRSSEGYTHVGTLPRLLRKRDKTNKEGPSSSKKTKEKSSLSRSQSQRPVVNHEPCPEKIRDASPKETRPEAKPQPQAQLPTSDDATGQNIGPNLHSESSEAVDLDLSPSGGPCADLQAGTCDETKQEEKHDEMDCGLKITEKDPQLTSESEKNERPESEKGASSNTRLL